LTLLHVDKVAVRGLLAGIFVSLSVLSQRFVLWPNRQPDLLIDALLEEVSISLCLKLALFLDLLHDVLVVPFFVAHSIKELVDHVLSLLVVVSQGGGFIILSILV